MGWFLHVYSFALLDSVLLLSAERFVGSMVMVDALVYADTGIPTLTRSLLVMLAVHPLHVFLIAPVQCCTTAFLSFFMRRLFVTALPPPGFCRSNSDSGPRAMP